MFITTAVAVVITVVVITVKRIFCVHQIFTNFLCRIKS